MEFFLKLDTHWILFGGKKKIKASSVPFIKQYLSIRQINFPYLTIPFYPLFFVDLSFLYTIIKTIPILEIQCILYNQ